MTPLISTSRTSNHDSRDEALRLLKTEMNESMIHEVGETEFSPVSEWESGQFARASYVGSTILGLTVKESVKRW